VAAYVILLPFQIAIVTEVRVAPADLFLFLAVCAGPARLQFRKLAWTGWHLALVAAFAIATFVTALQDGELNRYVVLNKNIGLGVLFLAYLIITSIAVSWGEIRSLIRIFVISVFLQNLAGLAAYFGAITIGLNTPLTSYEGRRLCGFLVDANAYGGLLVTALALMEGASHSGAPLFRGFTRLVFRVTLGMGVLFTFSRTAWISLAILLAALCVFRFRSAIRLLIGAGLAMSVLVIALGDRFAPLFREMAYRPEQTHGRLQLVLDGLSEFASHPWLGIGLGTFREIEGTIVHNSAVWFLAEFGIFGLLIFAGLVFWFLRKALFCYRFGPPWAKPLALGLLVAHIALIALSMGIEAFYQRHWWLVMALIASGYSITRRQGNSFEA
jgi:O-antigen ligase